MSQVRARAFYGSIFQQLGLRKRGLSEVAEAALNYTLLKDAGLICGLSGNYIYSTAMDKPNHRQRRLAIGVFELKHGLIKLVCYEYINSFQQKGVDILLGTVKRKMVMCLTELS